MNWQDQWVCVSMTVICIHPAVTLSAILLSGTRVGVCGATLEQFAPTHRLISVLRTMQTMQPASPLSVRLISDWIITTLRHGLRWVSVVTAQTGFNTSVICLQHTDVETTASSVWTEDSCRCMQRSNSKTTSFYMSVTTKTVSTGIFCIFCGSMVDPHISVSMAVCSPSHSAKLIFPTNNSSSSSSFSVWIKIYQQSQILFPFSRNYSPTDSLQGCPNWSSVLLKIWHMRGVR